MLSQCSLSGFDEYASNESDSRDRFDAIYSLSLELIVSNYLALSAVTATFQRVLQASIQTHVYGARVTTLRPNTLDSGPTETGVNLYLFLVTPNSAFRHNDPGGRRPNGNLVKRSHMAYDLQYLLSFYGSEAEFEPERLYGCVARTIQEVFTLTPDMIRDTLTQPNLQLLAESDLAEQLERVRIFPTEISLENLSKIWSVFFQTPYTLSAIYKATVVLIDSEDPGQRALPVSDRIATVNPFSRIVLQQVTAQAGGHEPITVTSTLLLKGQYLYHPNARVRIGQVEVTPTDISGTAILLPLGQLPTGILRAGVQAAQVVHPMEERQSIDDPLTLHNTSHSEYSVTSDPVPFILRPTVIQIEVADVSPDGRASYQAEVTVQFDVTVEPRQRVVLMLNEWSRDRARSYLYKAGIRTDDRDRITFTIAKIPAGEYLVRTQIDDAESLLTQDTDAGSDTAGWYNGPRLTIRADA